MKSIVEVVSDVVAATNKALNASPEFMKSIHENTGLTDKFELFYQFGARQEIAQVLVNLTKSPETINSKFPRLVLFTDNGIQESHDSDRACYDVRINKIAIITATNNTLLSDERFEINFKPILIPIYETFIEKLRGSRDVRGFMQFKHEKKDCFFWGTVINGENTSNDYNDYLDAIEINNIQLTINKKKNDLSSRTNRGL